MNVLTKLAHRPTKRQQQEQTGDVPSTALRASGVAVVAAVGAIVLWSAKAVAIGIAGGLGKSPAEGALFFIGLAAALCGAGALGVTLVARHGTLLKVVGAVGGVVALTVVAGLTNLVVVTLVQGDGQSWVWGEVNLWVAALALLTASLIWRSRHAPGGPPPRV